MTLPRIRLVTIIVILSIICIISLAFFWKSYQVIEDANFSIGSGKTQDFLFTIEKAEKPWKVQIHVTSIGGYINLFLKNAQGSILWETYGLWNSQDVPYEFEFEHYGELKFLFIATLGCEINIKIIEWKSIVGW